MILYIHPKSYTMLTEIYPLSLPALINGLSYPVRGVFEYELKAKDLRSVRIVLMDIHWYSSMASAINLSRRIRRVNREAVIIAGGISATLFSRQILRDSETDYVIRGDAEIPLRELVDAIMTGGDVTAVPNVAGKDFESSGKYRLTRADMDEGDYRELSFFPTLERRVWGLHRQARGKPFPTYPFLLSFRGCPFECRDCCGAPENQQRLFGRSWVVRSAEKLREDLEWWDSQERLNFVNIYHDFLCLLPEQYTQTVLARRYRLAVFYDFFRCPGEEALGCLLEAFSGGTLNFKLDQFHSNSDRPAEPEALIGRLKMALAAKKFDVQLTFNKHFARQDPVYAAAFRRVVRETGVWTSNGDYWWEDHVRPDKAGAGTEADYRRCFRERGKRYFWWNAVYGTGIRVHRYFPEFAKMVARRWLPL